MTSTDDVRPGDTCCTCIGALTRAAYCATISGRVWMISIRPLRRGRSVSKLGNSSGGTGWRSTIWEGPLRNTNGPPNTTIANTAVDKPTAVPTRRFRRRRRCNVAIDSTSSSSMASRRDSPIALRLSPTELVIEDILPTPPKTRQRSTDSPIHRSGLQTCGRRNPLERPAESIAQDQQLAR